MIDLRSDTFSLPTPQMRRAIADAELGDDCFGEDPSTRALEALVAEILGKEEAVFMPTGTMSNQVAIRSHTEPGDAVLMDQGSHVYLLEGGAPFALSGVHPRFLNGKRGVFSDVDIEAASPLRHPFFPRAWVPPARLLCIENTHNTGGGKIWPLESVRSACASGRKAGLRLHLDGARLWNATIATGIAEATWAAPFDSVSVCFSKGLGAPMGSALAGSADFITRARRFRAQFGGGLRQSGIAAAGALYAVKHHRERLREDHANAKLLAEALADVSGIEVDPTTVETNIVRVRLTSMSAGESALRLHAAGVHVLPVGPDCLRAVTYLNVTRSDISQAVRIVRSVMVEDAGRVR